MEGTSYSKLDQIDQVQIELTESLPAGSSNERSTVHLNGSTQGKPIDYVLAYETLKDTHELDDESLKELRKLSGWRNTFERCLENNLGFVLQRKVVNIEDVSFYL